MAQLTMLLHREDLYRLDSLDERENSVVTALLRNYGGLFTDFCYIDESLIAMQTGFGREEVYGILKDLSRRQILRFIPRKKIPHIRYAQSRVEAGLLVFSNEVYDDRKKEYAERIKSIINYAENDDICRSRQLLRYFGEKKSTDCGMCDVCINHNSRHLSHEEIGEIKHTIMQLLEDGQLHSISELLTINADKNVLKEVVEYMVSEEEVFIRDGMISK